MNCKCNCGQELNEVEELNGTGLTEDCERDMNERNEGHPDDHPVRLRF